MNEQTPSTQATLSGLPIFKEDGSPMLESEIKSVPETKPKSRLVIIHDTDADGICAAWCIHKEFTDIHPGEPLLIPQRAGVNDIPEGLTEYDDLFLVDRTYPWETLLELSAKVFSVTVIDHHKSAMKDYQEIMCGGLCEFENVTSTESSLVVEYGNINIVMDTKHAACMLAYNYSLEHGIDPDTTVGTPFFVKYIEDRDMWWFKLPDSKAVNAGLHHFGFTFKNFDEYYFNRQDVQVDIIRRTGNIVLETINKLIKSIACGPTISRHLVRLPPDHELAKPGYCTLHTTAVLCCPFSLISELGDFMLRSDDDDYLKLIGNRPSIVICYNRVTTLGKPAYTYSIRSTIDMLWLAKSMGGGGHPNACGFSSDRTPEEILEQTHST